MLTRATCAWLVVVALMLGGPAVAKDLLVWRGGATPSLELKDSEGQTHRLSDFRGKVVLINFWATWCEPCRDEMPSIQRLKNKLGDKPFAVLAVNVGESEARIADFLSKLPLDFTIVRDHSSAVMKAWRVRGLPASFVIGPDGRIRYHFTGEFEWEGDKVIKALTGLMPSR